MVMHAARVAGTAFAATLVALLAVCFASYAGRHRHDYRSRFEGCGRRPSTSKMTSEDASAYESWESTHPRQEARIHRRVLGTKAQFAKDLSSANGSLS